MFSSFFSKNKKNILSTENVKSYYKDWTDRYIESFEDVFQSNQGLDRNQFFDYYAQSAGINDNMNIIDAGCGVGGPANEFAKRFDVNIDAVNISEIQLKKAQQSASQLQLKGKINFISGDFHYLDKTTGHQNFYDLIYFMESLVHSDHVELVLQSAYKALKTGGVLYIKDLYRRKPVNFIDRYKINKSVKINNRLFALNIISVNKLLEILKNTGFELLFCKTMDIETNQNVGNNFVIKNKIVATTNDWHPYLEWHEIKCIKR